MGAVALVKKYGKDLRLADNINERAFTKGGASVVISDILLDGAQELAEKLKRGEAKVLTVKTDVSKKSDLNNLVADTLKEFGKIERIHTEVFHGKGVAAQI